MLKRFRTFQMAVSFHKQCKGLKMPHYLRDQLLRAASSIALNTAEGYGKISEKDKKRFYAIALGSLRECEAAIELAGYANNEVLQDLMDQIGACLWRLCHK